MHLLTGTYHAQEGKAGRRGIRFIAISSNILSHATIEGRNIWKEVEDGMWDVIGSETMDSKNTENHLHTGKAAHPRRCTSRGHWVYILSMACPAAMLSI